MLKGEIGLRKELNEIKKKLNISNYRVKRDLNLCVKEISAEVNGDFVVIKMIEVGNHRKVVCLCENVLLGDWAFGPYQTRWKTNTFDLASFAYFSVLEVLKRATKSYYYFDGDLFKEEVLAFLDKKSKEAEEAQGKEWNEGENDTFIFTVFELSQYIKNRIWQRGNYWACLEEIGERLGYTEFALDYGNIFGWTVNKDILTYLAIMQKVLETEIKDLAKESETL